MADILLLKRKHYAEDTKPDNWTDLRWEGRPLRGDIISVQPTGFYRIESLSDGEHGWDRNAFCLVRLTNVDASTIKHLVESYLDDDFAPTKSFKRRYRIAVWDKIPWIKNTITIGGVSVEEWYYIRATIGGQFIVTDKLQ
jgi:hypothetical protein